MAIIGVAVINRGASLGIGTHIEKENPALEAFTVKLVKIFAYLELTGVKVATFQNVGGNFFTTRAYATLGTVPQGYSEHAVSIAAEIGDYIGLYIGGGSIERDSTGEGIWTIASDEIPCVSQSLAWVASRVISLQGTGLVPPPVTVVSSSILGNKETEQGSILVNRGTERPGVLGNVESPGGSIFSNVGDERSGIRSGRA